MGRFIGAIWIGSSLVALLSACERTSPCRPGRSTHGILVHVARQLDIFKLDHGRYPEALEDLIVPPSYVNLENCPPEPYLRDYPVDGWGNRIVYRRGLMSHIPFTLTSYGQDGKEGGSGIDADITY